MTIKNPYWQSQCLKMVPSDFYSFFMESVNFQHLLKTSRVAIFGKWQYAICGNIVRMHTHYLEAPMIIFIAIHPYVHIKKNH